MNPQAQKTLRKREQREDRKQRILEAALTLIAQGGVDSVTHRRVAAAADVPLGSTTYYFDSREHLIQEAFDYHLMNVRELQAAIAPASVMVSDLEGMLANLGADKPADVAWSILHLVRGFELECLSRKTATTETLGPRLLTFLSAAVG